MPHCRTSGHPVYSDPTCSSPRGSLGVYYMRGFHTELKEMRTKRWNDRRNTFKDLSRTRSMRGLALGQNLSESCLHVHVANYENQKTTRGRASILATVQQFKSAECQPEERDARAEASSEERRSSSARTTARIGDDNAGVKDRRRTGRGRTKPLGSVNVISQ